jgi:hypothetical protein
MNNSNSNRPLLLSAMALMLAGLSSQSFAQAPSATSAFPANRAQPIPPESEAAPAPGLPPAPKALAPAAPRPGGQFGGFGGGGFGVAGGGGSIAAGSPDTFGGGTMPSFEGAATMAQPSAVFAGGYRSGSSRDSVPPVVVEFGNPDPTATQHLEEDLAIMSHIFSQSLERGLGEEAPQSKMGVPLVLTGGGRSVRAIYLGGFGALFMIKVNMPLMAAPAPADEKQAQQAVDSDWESARREVLGLNERNEFWTATSSSDAPFDPDQVEALKHTLISALKNANNIRGLHPEDCVSIAVFGQPMAESPKRHVVSATFSPDGKRIVTSDDKTGFRIWDANTGKQLEETSVVLQDQQLQAADEANRAAVVDQASENPVPAKPSSGSRAGKGSHKSKSSGTTTFGSARAAAAGSNSTPNLELSTAAKTGVQSGTVLTMRAKKADIAAFAEGKVSQDDFAKRIGIAAYPGTGYGVLSVNSWIQSGRNTSSLRAAP